MQQDLRKSYILLNHYLALWYIPIICKIIWLFCWNKVLLAHCRIWFNVYNLYRLCEVVVYSYVIWNHTCFSSTKNFNSLFQLYLVFLTWSVQLLVDQFNVTNAVRERIGPQTSGSSFFHPSTSRVINNTKMSLAQNIEFNCSHVAF